ncbi:MAG TPA: sugar-binding protein [Candidatus Hydrogenedentes bacterium]|nr:sugar-binding protein [Candidatus Hydrogenedentota bacterium]HOV73735.1 sugar-binding protein [Candidatus Hydrogenedentota bacterium]HPC17084.1 sugar-binding protein [Candidatus Hydrogenedentota bacterium]HRT20533.1 sugar-binding protein [Candidatus Hydrogenedentota bacterium]HRT65262.1 sugar-binding protein [Candidatus Hydrogenedentota bacterium]
MIRTLWTITIVALLAFGCGQSSKPEKTGPDSSKPVSAKSAKSAPKVAFVTNNASDFWKIAKAGTEKAAKEFGTEVVFRIPSTGTAQEQQVIVQDLITVGVSGIAISPKDPANQTAMLNKAAAAVNLVTQDSDAPESNRMCYIGTDNYQAGVAAGEFLKKTLPNGGKIMLFVGTLDAQNAVDRKRGIEDAIKGSGIVIVDTRTDETDRVKAKRNTQDALVTHRDLACLVGLWSYNGPSILSGVRDSGKLGQVKIVCFDEEEEALQGVKDGYIAGTIVQQPFEFGYQSVKVLTALAKGDKSVIPSSKQIIIPVKVITKENVDAFWSELKQLTGKR